MKSTRLIVAGDVQGVGFRQNIKAAADSRGIFGYAKNLKTGEVEVLLQGGERQVNEVVDTIRTSPAYRNVERVKREEVDEPGYTSFDIRTDYAHTQTSRYDARSDMGT